MIPIKSISIPEACHQSWQQMDVVNNGRHCQSCSKVVIDFTRMSDTEIIHYLTSQKNVCGRFNEPQLNNINRQIDDNDRYSGGLWRRVLLSLSLFGSTLFLKADAQVKTHPVEQTSVPQDFKDAVAEDVIIGKVIAPDSSKYRVIKGHITDDDNVALPGVMVRIQTTEIGTVTDNNGNFNLSVPKSAMQLMVNYIGFNNQQINVSADTGFYNVKLSQSQAWLGEIAVVRRTPFIKRVYYRCIKRPIKKIFN